MTRLSKALFVAASSIAMTGIAAAQDTPPEGEAAPTEGEPAPTEGAPEAAPAAATADASVPSLTLAAGKILIAGETATINLSSEAVGKPISLAPSVWYGVSDKLTIGLTHDGGTTPWTPRPAIRLVTIDLLGTPVTVGAGAGICLTGEENGCAKVYDNVGVDALFSLSQGKFSLAVHPALDVFSFDPFTLSLRAGVLGRYMVNDKLSVVFDPRIKIGLNERDFNKESIDIPVWLWYAVNPKLGAFVHTGIAGPLDGFGDAMLIPVGLGANYMASEKLTLGADFTFLNLIGSNSSADGRALGLRVIYAL